MYGSEEGYAERVMVLYDGLHYDALALAGEAIISASGLDVRAVLASGPLRTLQIQPQSQFDFPLPAAWPDAAERLDVTTFPTSGPVCQEAARGAAELVALAHTAHAFTNTADFTLRCGVCQVSPNPKICTLLLQRCCSRAILAPVRACVMKAVISMERTALQTMNICLPCSKASRGRPRHESTRA